MKKTWLPYLGAMLFAIVSSADSRPSAAQTLEAQAPSLEAGEASFQARCAKCHQQVGRLQSYMARRPDDAARRGDLDTFLTRHHASNAAERQAIIGWLLSQQKPAS